MSSVAVARKTAPLTGLQKAAVVCMVLGAETAARIQKALSTEESEAISVEIARLSHVAPDVAETVLREWLDLVSVVDSLAQGGLQFAQEVLTKAYGPAQANSMLKRIQTQLADTAGLHRLRNADPVQLGTMLRNEHPQTIALILSHLQPNQTAAVLKDFAAELGSEVVFRMATLSKVSPDMLALIERSIWSEDLETHAGLSSSGGPQAVATILALLPSSNEKALLDGVQGKDPALCQQIRDLMFVFEDIATLDDKSIQRLLRDVDVKTLALALKTASEPLNRKIESGMSSRAVAALREEIEMLGPQRKRDVEKAQSTVVGILRSLEEAGEIVIAGAGEDIIA